MPPLSLWDPKPSVLHWLKKNQHCAIIRPKGKQQRYFGGIFPEATNIAPDDDKSAKKSAEYEKSTMMRNLPISQRV